MAEITKVTSPLIPRENVGTKNRPVTEQAFELNNPNKVNKPQNDNKAMDREASGYPLRENMGSQMVQSLLRNSNDLMYNVQKMVAFLQLGISTSDLMQDAHVKQLLNQIFTNPEQIMEALKQQDESSVLFKGQTFDVLRDILTRFPESAKVKDAVIHLLKTFEQNVNTKYSVKTILYNCNNILDYMFSKDREQFASYLDGLAEMLLPQKSETTLVDEDGNPISQQNQTSQGGSEVLGIEQREAATVLKNNLLPLLGEIVVKYHQNEKIRDIVMVVVHNIVRVDKGTPEALKDAVDELVNELRKVANLPENFQNNLMDAIGKSATHAKSAQNEVLEKLASVISETLHSTTTSPPALRQAENLLLSLLQNQNSMMNVLHFMLPMQTDDDRIFAELYVDPDSDEHKKGKEEANSRKIFLTAESENHGTFEFCFWESSERVDFTLWCPQVLVGPLTNMRRMVGDLMQAHGYTMTNYQVQEFLRPQSVAEVFPKLLHRKVGIDVRI